MTQSRPMPGDAPTNAERKALRAFRDGRYKDASTAARHFGIVGRAAGNFGATVRRCYEKGFLSFRLPEGQYCITDAGSRIVGD